MVKHAIEYYKNGTGLQVTGNSIHYYIATAAGPTVDKLLAENGIIAGTGSLPTGDFNETKKLQKLYFTFALVIGLLFIFICYVAAILA